MPLAGSKTNGQGAACRSTPIPDRSQLEGPRRFAGVGPWQASPRGLSPLWSTTFPTTNESNMPPP
jgi:hypothetical protein